MSYFTLDGNRLDIIIKRMHTHYDDDRNATDLEIAFLIEQGINVERSGIFVYQCKFCNTYIQTARTSRHILELYYWPAITFPYFNRLFFANPQFIFCCDKCKLEGTHVSSKGNIPYW